MKKYISLFVITILLTTTLCGCNVFSSEKNTIGKSSNTVKTVYQSLVENFKLRKKEGYNLYAARLIVNSENVGTYTYIYTDERPDKLKYSDILVVEINNRTGRIEKFSAPEYSVYGSMPYDVIKSAMPLDPLSLKIDSDEAVKLAAKTHFGDDFQFNYIQTDLAYISGQPIYDIKHISLINNCIYKTQIDAKTGTVILKSTEAL